jgi:hypothetical protein
MIDSVTPYPERVSGQTRRGPGALRFGCTSVYERLRRERSPPVTMAMAVSIGWGVFLLEMVLLGWLIARHNR